VASRGRDINFCGRSNGHGRAAFDLRSPFAVHNHQRFFMGSTRKYQVVYSVTHFQEKA